MTYKEKIKGQDISKLVEKLKRDQTVLKIQIEDKDFGSRTTILGTREKGGISYFQIDFPVGFKDAVSRMKKWSIQFEFSGKDKVPHFFQTYGGEFAKGKIWIQFPKVIERVQRRQYFRINAPLGARFQVIKNDNRLKLVLINVSQKGARVLHEESIRPDPLFQKGDILKHALLLLPIDEKTQRIQVKESEVRTLEEDSQSDRYFIGLRFNDIDKNEDNKLRDAIYTLQRHYARKT